MEDFCPDRHIAGLAIRRVPLASLHLDPANARLHPDANLEAIVASLRRFGQAEPLVVQKTTGRIIGGNGRLVAMKKLGWTECDVVELEVDDLAATSLGIALNRTAELADWDEETLARLLRELQAEDALEGVGFDDAEIQALLRSIEVADELEDPGADEPPEHPVSRLGDLWLLGGHRLLCGDSTDPDDVARLMAGEKAMLLASDPPYLVDYDGTNHGFITKAHRERAARGGSYGGKKWDAYVDPESSVEFYATYLRIALEQCTERAPVYQWHATRRQALVEAAWEQNGLLLHQTIIWSKTKGVITRQHYLWKHEPCFYGWRKGMQPEKDRRPPSNETTIWEIAQRDAAGVDHPTVKPLEIFEKPIRCHTFAGEICLEPFSGGGTQIIAAERHQRRCFAMELSPGFVDVAVKRWQGATAREATLDGDGRTFEEIARARSADVHPDPA